LYYDYFLCLQNEISLLTFKTKNYIKMENRKLPNATAVLVLGILSILLCWCYGIIGLILSVIALLISRKDFSMYNAAPQDFDNYQNLNIGRILSIIGIVLNILVLAYLIWIISMIGMDAFSDPALLQERIKELQGN
jgi:M penetrans paralogue family 26